MSTNEQYDLGELPRLSAVAIGARGKRTFFLILGRQGDWIRAWLEKEMLEAMVAGIEQLKSLIAREGLDVPEEGDADKDSGGPPAGLPSFELEIEQVGLGYEKDKAILDFLVHALGP